MRLGGRTSWHRVQSRQCAGRFMSAIAAAGLAGSLVAACGGSSTSTPSAAQLMALNPGARTGGQTFVVTGNGQHLTAGPGADTVVALGVNETIDGGEGPDQMGALGTNATIVGGTASDVIYSGPKATLVSGPAPDLLVATDDDATIRLTSDGNQVMLSGHNDRVVCAPTSHNDVISANRSDSIDSTCFANNAHLSSLDQSRPKAAPRLRGTATLVAMTGKGTNDDPFIAPCDDPSVVDCTVTTFDTRPLSGFWKVEIVPAYRCPADHPFLVNHKYTPYGTTTVSGVEIRESKSPWPVNVFIPGNLKSARSNIGQYFAAGTNTDSASATNWDRGAWYKVVLHCTSNQSNGYPIF